MGKLRNAAVATSAALIVLLATASAAGAAVAQPTAPAASAAPTGTTGPAGVSGQPGAPATVHPRPAVAVLSNFSHEITRWAHTAVPGARIRSKPTSRARTVARLHLVTEDGLPEVYQLLSEQRDAHGTMWVHVEIPMRPNGRTGWVPRDDLGNFHVDHTMLIVSTERHRITLLRNGRTIFTAPVGTGKPSTPTPHGRFWIREKFPVPPGFPVYGPFALGTSDYSNVETHWPGGGIVGVHGTDQPGLVPGRPSHGCIRLHNADISRLYPLVPVGTPLIVQ